MRLSPSVAFVLAAIVIVPKLSPAIQTENPVVEDTASKTPKNKGRHSSPGVSPLGAESAPVGEKPSDTPKDEHRDKPDERIYRVDVVSKPFDWRDALYMVYIVATIAAAFVAWRALVAIKRQAGFMKDQLTQMREAGKQTDELINQTKEEVAALSAAADAAVKNATNTQAGIEAIISKERARIRIEVGDLRLVAPGRPQYELDEIPFKVFCDGATPAFILDKTATVNITDSIEPPDRLHLPISGLPSVFHPSPNGMEYTAHVYEDMDDAKRDAIRQGKLFAHFYGEIKYKDVFDRTRETRFRYLWKVTDIQNSDGSSFAYWTKHGKDKDNSE